MYIFWLGDQKEKAVIKEKNCENADRFGSDAKIDLV